MRRLDQFARDRKVEHCSGTTCNGGLMRCAATTPISRCNLSSDLVCRNLGRLCAVREFDHKLGRTEEPERNWSGVAIFFIVAHALGNVTLITQRLAKSTLDGPYKQFIHTLLWII
jgi:hypothetical protein